MERYIHTICCCGKVQFVHTWLYSEDWCRVVCGRISKPSICNK